MEANATFLRLEIVAGVYACREIYSVTRPPVCPYHTRPVLSSNVSEVIYITHAPVVPSDTVRRTRGRSNAI